MPPNAIGLACESILGASDYNLAQPRLSEAIDFEKMLQKTKRKTENDNFQRD